MNDIPLQTHPGSYRRPWLKRNGWWLATGPGTLLVIVLFATIGGLLGRPRTTTLTVRLVPHANLPIQVSKDELRYRLDAGDERMSREFSITNRSSQALGLQFGVLDSPLQSFPQGGLMPSDWTETSFGRFGDALQALPITMPRFVPFDEIGLRCFLVGGRLDEGKVPPNSTITLRLTVPTAKGAKHGESLIRLLILPAAE